jgi:hypothetical protein
MVGRGFNPPAAPRRMNPALPDAGATWLRHYGKDGGSGDPPHGEIPVSRLIYAFHADEYRRNKKKNKFVAKPVCFRGAHEKHPCML